MLTPSHSRRPTLPASRLFAWGGLVLVIGGSLGFGLLHFRRGQGEGRLRAALALAEPRGKGTGLAAVRRRAGQNDVQIQHAFAAHLETLPKALEASLGTLTGDWFLRGDAPPAELSARHARAAAYLESLRPIVQDRDLCASSLGWIGPALEQSCLVMGHTAKAYDPWKVVAIGRWLKMQSLLDPTPDAALTLLEQLADRMQPVGTRMDALIRSHLLEQRDESLLRLALRDQLQGMRETGWLQEALTIQADLADGIEGELQLFWVPWARTYLVDRDAALDALYPLGLAASLRLRLTWTGGHDIATALRAQRTWVDHLRGQAPYAQVTALDRRLDAGGAIAASRIGRSSGWRWMVVRRRFRFRMARLLVCIRRHARRRGELPEDAPALAVWLRGLAAPRLDPGPWDLPIVYTRLSPTRFRLAADPAGPMPAGTHIHRPKLLGAQRASGLDERRAVISEYAMEVVTGTLVSDPRGRPRPALPGSRAAR